MIDALPWATGLLAFPDFSEIMSFAVKGVLIFAGVVLGWFVGGPIGGLLFRLAFQRPAPSGVTMISKLGGAAVFGLLAFLIPIGAGSGSGFFGGDGNGKDSGQTGDKKGDIVDPTTKKPGRGSTPRDAETVLSVRVLGGVAIKRDGLFYQVTVKGEDKTLTRDELRTIIDKDRAGPRRLKTLEIRLDQNSVLRTNPVVTHLEDLGRAHKLSVEVIQEIPPAAKDPD